MYHSSLMVSHFVNFRCITKNESCAVFGQSLRFFKETISRSRHRPTSFFSSLNILSDRHFETINTFFPINEPDRDFAPKDQCAQCPCNRSKRLVSITVTHPLIYKGTLFWKQVIERGKSSVS